MAEPLDLGWSEASEEHVSVHEVVPNEVKEACTRLFLMYRRGTVRGQRRYILLGRTEAGRYLFVVVDALGGGRFEVVTARDMDDSERRLYDREMKGRGTDD